MLRQNNIQSESRLKAEKVYYRWSRRRMIITSMSLIHHMSHCHYFGSLVTLCGLDTITTDDYSVCFPCLHLRRNCLSTGSEVNSRDFLYCSLPVDFFDISNSIRSSPLISDLYDVGFLCFTSGLASQLNGDDLALRVILNELYQANTQASHVLHY